MRGHSRQPPPARDRDPIAASVATRAVQPELGLAGHALTPGAQRSYWLREALASDPGEPAPPLVGETTAEVVILGGGYTGMWTAYFLTELAPACRVVILEEDICGGGPSGRNGGFLTGWWDELPTLVALHGAEGAVASCRALSRSIPAIGEWCREHGVDAWFTHAGYLGVASSPAQADAWAHATRLAQSLGVGEEYRELSPAEIRARCDSPVFGGGVRMQDGATVQPARLARGMRRVLLQRGVRIYEQTPVVDFTPGTPNIARTPQGLVRADQAVVALNAWAGGLQAFSRSIVCWSSYIVLTAPAPERLAAIGWVNGECISDFRTSLHYFRTTPDGRIAFGGGGGRAGSGGKIGPVFTHDRRAVEEAAAGLRRLFPSFAGVPIEDAWGGPIDVSSTHLPWFGSVPPGNVHYALGYTGNGVAPSHLAGQILASLALQRESPLTRLPMVNARVRRFPPEPFRSLGAGLVRRAIVRDDDAGDRGRQADPLTRLVARMPRRMGFFLGPE